MEHIHESPSVGNGGVLTALTASTGAAVGTGASDDVDGGGSTRAGALRPASSRGPRGLYSRGGA